MKIKSTVYRYFWVVILVLVSACGTAPSAPVTSIPTTVTVTPVVESPTVLPTLTLMPFSTFDPRNQPTSPPTPLVNKDVIESWLTQNAFATPIRTPVTQTIMNKDRVYIENGNVYFQSSVGRSIQLTHAGKDRDPIISDDGQKIAFYRGENNDNVYSINTDGNGEQLIITSKSLPVLGQGEIKSLIFIPGTHFLLFNTYLCNPHEFLYNASDCTVSIYSIDTDSGKIDGFLAGLSGNTMQERNFEVSPNGRYISVANSGHIDIYHVSSGPLDGHIAYQNAILYWRTKPDEYLPKQYWLPDSSGIIVILASDGEYSEPATPPSTYTVYRYILDGTATQIPLDRTIISEFGDNSSISPDRNWILFAGKDIESRYYSTWHYLGNLNNGHTQAFEENGWPLYNCVWSPDSKHFVSNTNTPAGFIGSVDGSPPVPVGGFFLSWIDTTHYYYQSKEGGNADTIKTYIGEISGN